MKNRSKLLFISLALLSAASAQAQSHNKGGALYGELAYVPVKVEDSGYSVTPKVMRGIVGYEVNPNLAVEGVLAFGMSDAPLTVGSTSGTIRIDHMYGVFVRPKANLTKDFEVFGRVGIAHSQIRGSARGLTATDSDTNVAYGAGAAYQVTPAVAVTGDYMQYYRNNGLKATGLSVGVRMGF